MNLLKRTYLYKCWKTDRLVFTVVLLMGLGTLFCAALRREQFPFLLYGMYSAKEYPQQEYQLYTIKVNGRTVDLESKWDLEQQLIISPATHAEELSAADKEKLAAWLYTYLTGLQATGNYAIEVNRQTYSYALGSGPVMLKQQTVLQHGTP